MSDAAGRVLVLPPTRADSAALKKLFLFNRIYCCIVRDVNELCCQIREGAATVVISEEALTNQADEVVSCLAEQPVWSDLPIIALSKAGPESVNLAAVVPRLGSVSVLERPVRTSTLISLVKASIRARMRQYQVRDHMIKQAASEQALRQAEQIERAARTAAEHASQIKDEFLATLSHELRTPLHAILGWSQILRRAPELPSKVSEGLSVIERNARAQSQIISDLLDMSSIVSGKVRLDVQRADLAVILEAAVNTVRPAADAKALRLQVIVDPLAQPVRGDPSRLQQIFWNLLTNAVKFTPKGGRVSVSLERVNSHLEVNVQDSGEGIDPEFLPFVFDRFRQADSAAGRRHGGLGLGLSIVKQLVELHGGTVTVKSEGRGSGALFRVALPLRATIEEASMGSAEKAHPKEPSLVAVIPEMARPSLLGYKVLVVDDEPDARTLVRDLLEECQATISTAASANEALTMIAEGIPDLLISDIGMPEKDGYELIKRVRELPEPYSSLPAIALTAYARLEDRVKALTAGYQMHLAKPVEPVELLAMVASMYERSAR